ncbi:hypothetical protein EC957_002306 [Mortierella hygrophila]|uniref:Uncharacterized protein n=1 Tax=Mortierella hygrophila TaxID=979708 RepID=A0A9P6F542_9FUNG|nr:hypothetical protein EC957_002306 [Mortierella hygrophila]
MVTATPTALNSFNNNKPRTTATQLAKLRSQPIVVDLDAIPPPTSPLPIPNAPSSPIIPVARTAPRKLSQDKISGSPVPVPCSGSGSLRPPPRPRSIVSHMSLSNPPIESLPPVPVLLHSNDSYLSSTPTSPTSPTGPSFFSAISPRLEGIQCYSLPSNVLRSASMGRVSETAKHRPGRKTRTASNIAANGDNIPIQSEKQRARIACEMAESLPVPIPCDSSLMVSLEEPVNRVVSPIPIAQEESKEADITTVGFTALPERPMCWTATRYYGIESSMRWREGVDPIQKRFSSSNGSWRCQDRFAVFFRPGDDIGPDQVVKKTFWSEAWPYPIETILYGTAATTSTPSSTTTASTTAIAASSSKNGGLNRYSLTRGMETGEGERTGGYRSDHEGDRQISRGRTGSRQYSAGENVLKTAASFPSSGRSRDPRYITSEGVSKIAKVTIPMPDVAIDQMELVKAPVKVELCIYILESPLRVNATATLLGRTVEGTTKLYV